jgi:hypothetical protein
MSESGTSLPAAFSQRKTLLKLVGLCVRGEISLTVTRGVLLETYEKYHTKSYSGVVICFPSTENGTSLGALTRIL